VEFKRILAKAHSVKELSLDEIKSLLLANSSEQTQLFDTASAIREEHFGGRVVVRAVVELSNFCYCNCLYCGMRRENNSLQRYRLSVDDIRQQAREARELGIGTLFLQSGEDLEYPLDDLYDAIRWATSENDQTVILCIGRRGRREYERLLAAGATKFIFKYETSNPLLFARMKPGAILLNLARGGVVDEAISEGRLSGAGIDVFDGEPIDPQNPLIGLENVMLTPHIAGANNESQARIIAMAADNVARVLAGEKPL